MKLPGDNSSSPVGVQIAVGGHQHLLNDAFNS